MTDCVHAMVWLYQEGTYVNAEVTLTEHHPDGSKETVMYPIRLSPQADIPDPESWTRHALAEVIEGL